MQTRTTRVLPIWSLMFVLGCACGGHPAGHGAGNGSGPDSGGTVGKSGPSSMPAASAASGSGGSSGQSAGSAPPFGSSASPGSALEADASCTPGVLPSPPPGSGNEACWTCMTRGCMAELARCVADCACNAAIGELVSNMNRPGQITACGAPPLSVHAGPPALGAAEFCLTQACLDCGCSCATYADAENCVPGGGFGSFGNGQCSSSMSMPCNGTNYEIVCSCPDAKCACFGPISQVIPYSGCPYCPSPNGPQGPSGPSPKDLFAQCGFPQ
jgi:hypothetical protein